MRAYVRAYVRVWTGLYGYRGFGVSKSSNHPVLDLYILSRMSKGAKEAAEVLADTTPSKQSATSGIKSFVSGKQLNQF